MGRSSHLSPGHHNSSIPAKRPVCLPASLLQIFDNGHPRLKWDDTRETRILDIGVYCSSSLPVTSSRTCKQIFPPETRRKRGETVEEQIDLLSVSGRNSATFRAH